MATIIIKRPYRTFDRNRNFQIFLDGRIIGAIANGQSMEFEITQGQHSVFAKVGWCKSQEHSFILNETIKKELTVDIFKYGNWILPIIITSFGLNLIFRLANKPAIGLILMIAPLLFLFYYWTIGRNKYLTLNSSTTTTNYKY
jgi:hypothetical protein